MKKVNLYLFLPVLLCMALALSLAACGGQDKQPADDQTGQATSTISGSKGELDVEPTPTPELETEEGKQSLAMLRDSMTNSDQIAGAVAYLGYWEQGEFGAMTDWLQANCAALVEELPFLLEIPPECILGGGIGEVY